MGGPPQRGAGCAYGRGCQDGAIRSVRVADSLCAGSVKRLVCMLKICRCKKLGSRHALFPFPSVVAGIGGRLAAHSRPPARRRGKVCQHRG